VCAARARQSRGIDPSSDWLLLVARYGFAGPAQWKQLDTALAPDPSDTRWVLRAPVCLDAGCTASINVVAAHWSVSNLPSDVQAQQSVAFMAALPPGAPRVMVGDFNI
jgi:endonuclease/exonuclease/phosphatase family metal-dependent hydrolase